MSPRADTTTARRRGALRRPSTGRAIGTLAAAAGTAALLFTVVPQAASADDGPPPAAPGATRLTPSDDIPTTPPTTEAKSDWSLRWYGPKGPVEPGQPVTTRLIMTNHGPNDHDTNDVVVSFLAADGSTWQDVKLLLPTPGGCAPTFRFAGESAT